MKQPSKPDEELAWSLTNLGIRNFVPLINNDSFNQQTIYNPIKFSNRYLYDSPLGRPILATIIEENDEDIRSDSTIIEETDQDIKQDSKINNSSAILQDKNLSEEIISKVELFSKSLIECFIPQTSQNKIPDSNDTNCEKSQPSSVFENIGINISHALRKTQNDSKLLRNDLTKLFMLDQLFNKKNDSQNR